MRKLILSALILALAPALSSAQTVVSSNVTTNTTWSGTIILDGAIFVKDGATLTIDPGTIVRGQPRTAAVQQGSAVGTPGALIVTQDGTIDANGTALAPIIMTTAAVDNNNDGIPDDDDTNGFLDAWVSGDTFYDDTPTTAPLSPLAADGSANVTLWGGVVILGNALTNLGDEDGVGIGSGLVEGLTVPGFPPADATYGGIDDADSSGSLEYVSIRHAGDEIGNSNELNGLTLAGVGTGTTISFVEIYCNFDDGVEWFGGAVNGDHLNVVFAGDAQFDADQGYTGINQFLAAILPFFNEGDLTNFGSSSGDKGCECDGDDYDETSPPGLDVTLDLSGQPDPFSNAVFWNVTIAGSDVDSFNSHTNNNDGWEMRNGFGGALNNAVIINTGGRQGIDLAGGGTSPGFTTTDNVNAGLISVSNTTCDDVTSIPLAPSDEATALANGGSNDGCSGTPAAGFQLLAEDTSFDPQGVSGKLAMSLGTIDLRPEDAAAPHAGVAPPAGLDTAATYRGAFEPADSSTGAWVDGWTALSMGGIIPVPEPGMMQLIVPGVCALMALNRRRR